MSRTSISSPTQFLAENNYLYGSVLHFGEGKAYLDTLAMINLPSVTKVVAYDPNSATPAHRSIPGAGVNYDFGVANYVLNTLTMDKRREALLDLYRRVCYALITVRIDKVKGEAFSDGVITSRGTFQCQFAPEEWVAWIVNALVLEGYSPRITILNKTRNYLMVEVV